MGIDQWPIKFSLTREYNANDRNNGIEIIIKYINIYKIKSFVHFQRCKHTFQGTYEAIFLFSSRSYSFIAFETGVSNFINGIPAIPRIFRDDVGARKQQLRSPRDKKLMEISSIHWIFSRELCTFPSLSG